MGGRLKHQIVLLAASLACLAPLVEAQSPPMDAAECKKPSCVPPDTGSDGIAIAYPKTLRESGVQGKTVVSFIVGVDGAVSDLVIDVSSRSEELDAGVLNAVAAHIFKPGMLDGHAVPMRRQLPVEFNKDDLVNLRHKTCADITVDAAYFRKTYPELPLEDMRINKLVRSMRTMVIEPLGKSAKDFADRQRELNAAFSQAVDWCAANPHALFLGKYNQEAG